MVVRHRTIVFGSALFVVAGCSQPATIVSGRDCFPTEAARWMATSRVDDAFAGRTATKGPVTVYVDASGSMVGYVNGATEVERPFQDLISTLPDLYAGTGSPVAFKTFGTRIVDIGADQRDSLLKADLYACRGVEVAKCDNRETRLDLVLRDIDAQKDGLALVLTDMWFADPTSQTSGLVPLSGPLEKILSSGRAVGVYGISTPFSGTIYDLPGGGQTSFTGRRPLVLLAIGSNARVKEFQTNFKRSPSQSISLELANGDIHQSIFTLDPSLQDGRPDEPLSSSRDPRVRLRTVLEAVRGVRIQQFEIRRSEAIDPRAKGGADPSWTGPDDKDFIDNAVWRGPLRTRVRIWESRGGTCGKVNWIGPTGGEAGWSSGGSGQRTYTLDPLVLTKDLPRSGTYMITGEVARVSLDEQNASTAWMRDWSFAPLQQSGLTADGGFYRTLNLAEFSRLMENALAKAAESNPGPITGFTYVVRIKD
jgi:hypothetical protein